MVTSLTLVQLAFDRSTQGLIVACGRAMEVHGKALVVCGWWLVPTLCCYQYVGGLPWKYEVVNPHSISIVLRKLLSGEVYDYGRGVPYVTMGTLVGIFCIFIGHIPHSSEVEIAALLEAPHTSEVGNVPMETPHPSKVENSPMESCTTRRRHIFCTWLALSFIVSLALFLGRGTFGALYDAIPFHGEMESLRYLNTLHFLGLLLFGVGTSVALIYVCRFLARISGYTINQLVVMVMLLGVPVCLSNQSQRIASHLTASEMSEDLRSSMQLLKEHPIMGRLYGNKHFGRYLIC